MTLFDYIEKQLEKLHISVDSNQLKLFDNYVSEVAKWNKIHNLTGIKTKERLVDLLVLDSVLVTYHIDFLYKHLNLNKLSILDVGSGNGSPGIIWSIIKTDASLTLIEKNRKKAAFLNSLIQMLNLTGRVKVCQERVEKFLPQGVSNLITCRAFTDVSNFLEITNRFASEKTCWLLMTTCKLSQGISDQFLKKRGIIELTDTDGFLSKLHQNYERNFSTKKVLLLKKMHRAKSYII